MRLAVLPVTSPEQWEGARAVRRRVFVEEQGVPEELEWDELDATAHHVVALDGGEVIATGRLVALEPGIGRIGRMAVDAERRQQGVGRAILTALEEAAAARGLSHIILHAQVQALGFYERCGYTVEGEAFDDAGIAHREMRKVLKQ